MARPSASSPVPRPNTGPRPLSPRHDAPADDRLGELLLADGGLSSADVARVLRHQQDHGLRFGEAAVALGLADAEQVFGALARQFHYPCVHHGHAPTSAELVMLSQPFGPCAERFRTLRGQLSLGAFQQGALAVVSAQSGDGRSRVAANLALALAQRGASTLLIDADLRQPRQHALFGLSGSAGLSALLAGRAGADVEQPVPGVPGLSLVPAGAPPPNPQELVEQPLFAQWLAGWCATHDCVIVDTPAAASGADAVVIAARCQAALIVARRGVTPLSALAALQRQLAPTHTAIAGVVLNEH